MAVFPVGRRAVAGRGGARRGPAIVTKRRSRRWRTCSGCSTTRTIDSAGRSTERPTGSGIFEINERQSARRYRHGRVLAGRGRGPRAQPRGRAGNEHGDAGRAEPRVEAGGPPAGRCRMSRCSTRTRRSGIRSVEWWSKGRPGCSASRRSRTRWRAWPETR